MPMESRDDDLTAFLEAHTDELLRFGFLLTRNDSDAADLVQDALVRVWSRRSGDAIDDLGAYIRAAMVRRHISLCRRDTRWRRVRHLLASVNHGPSADQGLAARDELTRALDELSPMQRAAFSLQLFEDLTVDDIAARLGCSPGSAKRHLFDARQRLAKTLTRGETAHDHR